MAACSHCDKGRVECPQCHGAVWIGLLNPVHCRACTDGTVPCDHCDGTGRALEPNKLGRRRRRRYRGWGWPRL